MTRVKLLLFKIISILFVWMYDIKNSALLINYTCNAITRKKIIIILPQSLDEVWTFNLDLKLTRLLYPLIFTGTVLSTLRPDYGLRTVQELMQFFDWCYIWRATPSVKKFSSFKKKKSVKRTPFICLIR